MNEDLVNKTMQRASSYLQSEIINLKSSSPLNAIIRVYLTMLIDSTSKLETLSNKHEIAFFNMLEANYKPSLPLHTMVQFSLVPESTGMILNKGTQLQSQSEDENLITLSLQEDVYVSDARIMEMYCCNGKGKIVHDVICNTVLAFDFTRTGQQKYAFTFHFPYLLENVSTNNFDIYFIYQSLPAITFMDFISGSESKWYATVNDQIICPLELKNRKEYLEINIDTKNLELLQAYDQLIDITIMTEELTNTEIYCFDNIQVSQRSTSYFADHVYVGEVPEDKTCFMPFTKELEPFNSCYIAFDKVLCKKEASISLKWHQTYQEVIINPFETVIEEYHMIMRSLPKEPLKVQDVYPDIVVFEYFNGEEWTIIKECKEKRNQFYQLMDKEMDFTFTCPTNISSVMVEGIEAYWLRIRLLQCNQRYQYPCCLHIPTIENMRASYQYYKDTLVANKLEIFHQLDKKDAILLLKNHQPIIPFKPLSKPSESMYWYLESPIVEDPFTMYLDIFIEEEVEDNYIFYGSSQNGFVAIQVDDGTDGFSHSGVLRFYFHHLHDKMTLFNQEGYWIKVERHSMQPLPKPILINKMIFHVGHVKEEETITILGDIESYQEDFLYFFGVQEVYDVSLSMFEIDAKGKGEWQEWTLHDSDTYRKFYLEDTLLRVTTNDILQGNVQKYQITYKEYQKQQQNIVKGSRVFLVEDHPFIEEITTSNNSYGSIEKESTKQAIERMQHTLQYNQGILTKEDVYHYFKSEYRHIVDLKILHNQDSFGNKVKQCMIIAMLMDDFALGSPSLYDSIKPFKQILSNASFLCGRNIEVIFREPIYLHVCLTLKIGVLNHDTIIVQKQLEEYFKEYFHPITGRNGLGWKIGNYPQQVDIIEAIKTLSAMYSIHECYLQCWYRYQGKKIVRNIEEIRSIMSLGCIVFGEHHIKVIKEE